MQRASFDLEGLRLSAQVVTRENVYGEAPPPWARSATATP